MPSPKAYHCHRQTARCPATRTLASVAPWLCRQRGLGIDLTVALPRLGYRRLQQGSSLRHLHGETVAGDQWKTQNSRTSSPQASTAHPTINGPTMKFRAQRTADRVNTTWEVWQGQTLVACSTHLRHLRMGNTSIRRLLQQRPRCRRQSTHANSKIPHDRKNFSPLTRHAAAENPLHLRPQTRCRCKLKPMRH